MKLKKIDYIKTKKISRMGLVFVYPDDLESEKTLNIKFDHQYEDIVYNPDNFMNFLTSYIDMIEKDNPPPIPPSCQISTNRQDCVMHTYFYDQKKLNGRSR